MTHALPAALALAALLIAAEWRLLTVGARTRGLTVRAIRRCRGCPGWHAADPTPWRRDTARGAYQ